MGEEFFKDKPKVDMNKFIETVKQENKDLNELENIEISEEAKKVKLDILEYKYRRDLYLSLNNNVTKQC